VMLDLLAIQPLDLGPVIVAIITVSVPLVGGWALSRRTAAKAGQTPGQPAATAVADGLRDLLEVERAKVVVLQQQLHEKDTTIGHRDGVILSKDEAIADLERQVEQCQRQKDNAWADLRDWESGKRRLQRPRATRTRETDR
jgi:hypothetical protein